MLVSALSLQVAERVVNHLLTLDADVDLLLKPLQAKVIEIQIKPFDWRVYCCPYENGMQILDRFDGPPDTTIIGSAPAFLMMTLSDSPMAILNRRDVVIKGDVETGRWFQSLFERLEPDLEERLSVYTGDVIAHRAGNMARSGRGWAREVVNTLQLDFAEFFKYESRVLPTPIETDRFFSAVDELRADEDRLEARVNRLVSVLSQN